MLKIARIVIPLFACLFLSALLGQAQPVVLPRTSPPEWSAPYQPFRIAGNLYYIGTYDLACYLITTPQGHILINTGLGDSEPVLKANMEALGFRLADIKILLTMQAHYDHLGAMAAIKKTTGARMMVDAKDAKVMADGGKSDYAMGGSESTFVPVQADRLLNDGDTIQLGGMRLVMLHHPGHTQGSCSFLFDVKDAQRSYRVLIANMPTIITDKDFSDIPAYPGIAADYAYTFSKMEKLSFDLWLSAHASQFALHTKHKPGAPYHPAAFMDRRGYDAAVSDLKQQYLKKIHKK